VRVRLHEHELDLGGFRIAPTVSSSGFLAEDLAKGNTTLAFSPSLAQQGLSLILGQDQRSSVPTLQQTCQQRLTVLPDGRNVV
jgi:hypothetical protein